MRASWLSAALILAPLSLFGEWLIMHTHHRPLGAATFSSAAVLLWGLSEVVSRRLLNPQVCAKRARARSMVWAICLLLNGGLLVRALF